MSKPIKPAPIHFVYKSPRGLRCDYFACDTDPNEGSHLQALNWGSVTCPDCLARKPKWGGVSPDCLAREPKIPPVSDTLAGNGVVSPPCGSAVLGAITLPGSTSARGMDLLAVGCAVLWGGQVGTVVHREGVDIGVYLYAGQPALFTTVNNVELLLLRGEVWYETSVARCLYWLAELGGLGDVVPPLMKVDGIKAYVLNGDVQGQCDYTGHEEEKTVGMHVPELLDVPEDEWELLHALRTIVLAEGAVGG